MIDKDYRYITGIIGNYGKDNIYVMPESDYTLARKKEKDFIFALTSGDSEVIKLVNRGMWIGNMSPQGKIELFERAYFYAPIKNEEKNIKIVNEGFIAGENSVDRFKRRMRF